MSRALLILFYLLSWPAFADIGLINQIRDYFFKQLAVEAEFELADNDITTRAQTTLGFAYIIGHSVCHLLRQGGWIRAMCVPLNVNAVSAHSLPERFVRSRAEVERYSLPEFELINEFREKFPDLVRFKILNQRTQAKFANLFPVGVPNDPYKLSRESPPMLIVKGAVALIIKSGRELNCSFTREVWRLDRALIDMPSACDTSLMQHIWDRIVGHFPKYKGPLVMEWQKRLQENPATKLTVSCK